MFECCKGQHERNKETIEKQQKIKIAKGRHTEIIRNNKNKNKRTRCKAKSENLEAKNCHAHKNKYTVKVHART